MTKIGSGRAFVNGIHIYHEVHGNHDGIPLVLLHGGGSTIDSTFGLVLPLLARTRRVIALEEQGRGRTSDRDRPFTFEASADDVAGLLRYLNVPQADLLGFSNGASVALQVAIRHPQVVRKLVFASSFTTREGAQPQIWEFISNTRSSCRGCSPMRACSSCRAGTATTSLRCRARRPMRTTPRSRLACSTVFSQNRSRTAEAAAGEALAVILFWRKSPVFSNDCRDRGAEARCRRGNRRARACPGRDARHGQSRPDDSHPRAPHRGLEGRDVTEARRGWSVPLVSATR